MTQLGEEISGTIRFNGIDFEAGYRYNGPTWHQGGFTKCLRIYSGKNKFGSNVYGHDYFGDDKFMVEEATITQDEVLLELSFPLHEKNDLTKYNPNTFDADKKVVLKRK